MLGKVVCVGSNEKRTFPKPYVPPGLNHRTYYWPGPGEILYYGERAGEPERRTSEFLYGMLVIENQMVREDDIIQREVTMRDRVEDGRGIAADIARRWFQLGSFQLTEEQPAEGQLEAAKERRRATAENHLHTAIRSSKWR